MRLLVPIAVVLDKPEESEIFALYVKDRVLFLMKLRLPIMKNTEINISQITITISSSGLQKGRGR